MNGANKSKKARTKEEREKENSTGFFVFAFFLSPAIFREGQCTEVYKSNHIITQCPRHQSANNRRFGVIQLFVYLFQFFFLSESEIVKKVEKKNPDLRKIRSGGVARMYERTNHFFKRTKTSPYEPKTPLDPLPIAVFPCSPSQSHISYPTASFFTKFSTFKAVKCVYLLVEGNGERGRVGRGTNL